MKSSASNPQSVVFVVGMHRSGTSMLAGSLVKAGGGGAIEEIGAGRDNPRGTFESQDVVNLNDTFLGIEYREWFHARPISGQPNEIARLKAKHLLQNGFECKPVLVVKDPRISLFLPLWIQAAKEAALEPKVIIACRSPTDVVRSLASRNGFEIEHSVALWLRYMLLAERTSRDVSRIIVDTETFIDHPKNKLTEVLSTLSIPLASNETISRFVDKTLLNRNREQAKELPFDANAVHHLFQSLSRNASDMPTQTRLGEIESEIDRVSTEIDERLYRNQRADFRKNKPVNSRLLFSSTGEPRRWLRALLFRNDSHVPRAFFRRLVVKKNGALRPVFHHWLWKAQRSR